MREIFQISRVRSQSESYENVRSRVKVSNVNFRKSVVLWANSGGGGGGGGESMFFNVDTDRGSNKVRHVNCLTFHMPHVRTAMEIFKRDVRFPV